MLLNNQISLEKSLLIQIGQPQAWNHTILNQRRSQPLTCLSLCDPPWRNIDATASHTNLHRRMSVVCASQYIATLTLIIAPSTQLLPHTDRHRPMLTEYWRSSDRYESWMWHLCSKVFENARRVLRQPIIYWLTLTLTQRKWNGRMSKFVSLSDRSIDRYFINLLIVAYVS